MSEISVEDDNFDPMAKDYNDPTFNSYKSGPGSYINPGLHTQKGWENKGQNYKLYVNEIPLGINKSGFANIFSNFGVLTYIFLDISKSKKCKFGFVEYKTLREAEQAMYSVNKVPPLNLVVKFSITDEAKKKRSNVTYETPMETLEELPTAETDNKLKDVGRGRGQLTIDFQGLKPNKMKSSYCRYIPYTSYSEPLKTHPFGEFRAHIGDELHHVFNEALTYEKPIVTKNQRYLMYMGRGYALKNLIDHSERYISQEQKEFKFSNESSTPIYQTKPCFVCSEEARRVCFNCQSWYCSKICFRNDSPNHTINTSGLVICYNVRALEESNKISKDSPFSSNDHQNSARGIFVKKLIFPPLIDKTPEKTEQCFKDVSSDSQENQIKIYGNRNSYLKKSHYIRCTPELGCVEECNLSSLSLTEKEMDGTLVEQVENESSSSNLPSNEGSNELNVSSEEAVGPLPFNTYTDVIVAHVLRKSEYYVNLSSLSDVLSEVSEMLSVMGGKKPLITQPVLGEVYIRSYQNIWCRAMVTGLNPLRVLYIDYGNEEEIGLDNRELRVLPSSLATSRFPPMVFKIRMAERTSDLFLSSVKLSMKLSVKPISKVGETYVVVAEGGEYTPTQSNTSLEKEKSSRLSTSKIYVDGGLNHLLLSAELCKHFEITVSQVMNEDRICGTLNLNPDFFHLTLNAIENKISNSDPLSPEQVNLGDVVGCLTNEGVCARGYLMSIIGETRRIALVDLGCVSIADQLCHVPPSLQNVPEAAVSCTFTRPNSNIKVGSKLHCHSAKLNGCEVCCEVEGYGTCTLSVWRPRIEDGGLSSITVQSGCKVTISSYYSPQAIYVQSSELKQKELLNTLLQDIATYSCTAPLLNRDPEVDEVVSCLFPEDQNFYRAQVYRRRGKLFSVIFLDFGNSFDVSPSDMRILCDSLKVVPCCAVKIGLKGVNDSVLTAETEHFLNSKCAGNEQFYLEFEDSLKDSVLKTTEGLVVNKKINDVISPHWKKCLEEGTDPTNGEVFFSSDVKYLKWDVKSLVKLLIIKQLSVNSYLVINTQDGLLDFMRNWFTPRISAYCSSFSRHFQYTPRVREICFVKMQDDDVWYRAVCTKMYNISCWVVLIDFGNTGEVYFRNVRPMTNEFILFPSILKKCKVLGVPDKCPNDGTEKLSKILDVGSIHDAIVINEVSQGIVTAYFNDVAKIFEEIGLPPVGKPD